MCINTFICIQTAHHEILHLLLQFYLQFSIDSQLHVLDFKITKLSCSIELFDSLAIPSGLEERNKSRIIAYRNCSPFNSVAQCHKAAWTFYILKNHLHRIAFAVQHCILVSSEIGHMLILRNISDTKGITCLEKQLAIGIAQHEEQMLPKGIITFPMVLLKFLKTESRIIAGLFQFRVVACCKQDTVAVIYISRLQEIGHLLYSRIVLYRSVAGLALHIQRTHECRITLEDLIIQKHTQD